LPQHEAVVSEAAKLVGELTQRREQALRDAVMEALGTALSQTYLPAMLRARAVEKNCWDVADAFTQSGDTRSAARVTELLRAAKAKLPIPPTEPARAQRWFHALLHDAAAQIGDP
jgi:hypothetical protein